jgi:hypothetical protein
MNTAHLLPSGFETLEPFVAQWALGTSAQRAAQRSQSTAAEREEFFKAAAPLMDAALDYLDGRELGTLNLQDQKLMDLMLSLAHVALAVEIQGPDETKSAPWRDRMQITRSAADSRAAA